MNRLPLQQKGASAIVNLILLVALGYGAYLGIQYVPQVIESKSIDSILKRLENTQKTSPVSTVAEAKTNLVKMLQINEMNDMMDSFSVEQKSNDGILIVFSYDRELNLGYKKKKIEYRKELSLN